MRYDVIVAGAGPAGSTAARVLARQGASVFLLDRARFPRDKPCGGGVTLRAASALDIDIAPVVERTIYGARFSLRLGGHFDRFYDRPLTYMTQRCRLDEFLANAAVEAGADFHDGEQILEVEADGVAGGVTLRTASGSYEGRVLVGADGANGIVGRWLGPRHWEDGVALEGNLPYSDDIPLEWHELVALDLGGLAGGYGWVFPKGDHLNVGVGAWKYAGFTLRPKLAELCRRYGFDSEALESLRGHHLPLRQAGSPVAKGPVLLVGDAAGFVDPLSGEGIHMACYSASLAADAIGDVLAGRAADLRGYQRAIEEIIQPELDLSRDLQELFHFAPPPYVAMMRGSERFWHLFCRLIRGDFTYQSLTRRLGPMRVAVGYFAGVARRRRLARLSGTLN